MRTRIVAIGNSQGIRIPKPLLEESGLGEVVDVTVENSSLVIRPVRKPRDGWDAAFAIMAERGDDALLDSDAPSLSSWDDQEWKWE
ncbi:MAG: AbrB/MazE/SpoVT family DNA-binding domain-containing protein [Bythopirellula sp.]|nr:AbrB/MazE/SpoVT family DNA-binding domain-containing protein [Bythopirellula sp.]